MLSALTLLKNWRRRFIVVHPDRVTWSKQRGGDPQASSLSPTTKMSVPAEGRRLNRQIVSSPKGASCVMRQPRRAARVARRDRAALQVLRS